MHILYPTPSFHWSLMYRAQLFCNTTTNYNLSLIFRESWNQQRNSLFGNELLDMYLAVKHFQHSLEGRQFVIFISYRPLTFTLRSKPDKYSPRETRHLDFVSQFANNIRRLVPSSDQFSPTDIDLRQMALDKPRLDTLDL